MAGEFDSRARESQRRAGTLPRQYSRPPQYVAVAPPPSSSRGPALQSSSSSSSPKTKTASQLQQDAFAEQRKAQKEAEARADAKQREAEVKAAKKARGESIRQNKVTREQANAQHRLLGRFDNARDIKIENIDDALSTADKALFKSYKATAGQLIGAREDNEKAEASASFTNSVNRRRESGDLMTESAAMGAGESDTLRTQLQAVRNWDSNQQDIVRSFFDTERTVNSSITDLTNDTRTSRINLREQASADKEQVWANYYNQMSDTWTQIYNIEGSNPNLGAKNRAEKGSPEGNNPIQAYNRKYGKAAWQAAAAAGRGYERPGIPKWLQNWEGIVQPEETRMNTSRLWQTGPMVAEMKRPEGSTLRYVDQAPSRNFVPKPAPRDRDAQLPAGEMLSSRSITSKSPRPDRGTGVLPAGPRDVVRNVQERPDDRTPVPETTTPKKGSTTVLKKWGDR